MLSCKGPWKIPGKSVRISYCLSFEQPLHRPDDDQALFKVYLDDDLMDGRQQPLPFSTVDQIDIVGRHRPDLHNFAKLLTSLTFYMKANDVSIVVASLGKGRSLLPGNADLPPDERLRFLDRMNALKFQEQEGMAYSQPLERKIADLIARPKIGTPKLLKGKLLTGQGKGLDLPFQSPDVDNPA